MKTSCAGASKRGGAMPGAARRANLQGMMGRQGNSSPVGARKADSRRQTPKTGELKRARAFRPAPKTPGSPPRAPI